VVSSPPATEEIGAICREIESRQGFRGQLLKKTVPLELMDWGQFNGSIHYVPTIPLRRRRKRPEGEILSAKLAREGFGFFVHEVLDLQVDLQVGEQLEGLVALVAVEEVALQAGVVFFIVALGSIFFYF
jgi:hypothetical protein